MTVTVLADWCAPRSPRQGEAQARSTPATLAVLSRPATSGEPLLRAGWPFLDDPMKSLSEIIEAWRAHPLVLVVCGDPPRVIGRVVRYLGSELRPAEGAVIMIPIRARRGPRSPFHPAAFQVFLLNRKPPVVVSHRSTIVSAGEREGRIDDVTSSGTAKLPSGKAGQCRSRSGRCVARPKHHGTSWSLQRCSMTDRCDVAVIVHGVTRRLGAWQPSAAVPAG